MRGGPCRGHPVAAACLQVGRAGEPGEVGGARRRDGREFVRAPGSHLDDRAGAGCAHHAGRGGCDRAVVVEHGQHERFEEHTLGEGARNGKDGGVRKERLTLGVAVDVAGEPVAGEPFHGARVDHSVGPQVVELVGAEPEPLDRIEEAARAGHYAVAAPDRKVAGKDFEHAPGFRRPRPESGRDHGELVVIGEQGRAGQLNGHGAKIDGVALPSVAPQEVERPEVEDVPKADRPWVTIVWNDPVNLMSYVTYVFQKLFGYPRDKAHRLMLQVHHEGRAVVSSGSREQMEHDVARLHAHGLWATMQQD